MVARLHTNQQEKNKKKEKNEKGNVGQKVRVRSKKTKCNEYKYQTFNGELSMQRQWWASGERF